MLNITWYKTADFYSFKHLSHKITPEISLTAHLRTVKYRNSQITAYLLLNESALNRPSYRLYNIDIKYITLTLGIFTLQLKSADLSAFSFYHSWWKQELNSLSLFLSLSFCRIGRGHGATPSVGCRKQKRTSRDRKRKERVHRERERRKGRHNREGSRVSGCDLEWLVHSSLQNQNWFHLPSKITTRRQRQFQINRICSGC